jgi:hypothetical protein
LALITVSVRFFHAFNLVDICTAFIGIPALVTYATTMTSIFVDLRRVFDAKVPGALDERSVRESLAGLR